MRRILIIFLLIFSAKCFPQEASVQFEQGNQFYRDGEYDQAVKVYEQIIRNGYESVPLYYNLGNAYFKVKNIPASILNFERAKRLSPDDEDVDYNLRLANLSVVDKIEPIPNLFVVNWWLAFLNMFPSDGWVISAIIFVWLAAFSGMFMFMLRRAGFQRVMFLLAVLTLFAAAVSFLCTIQRKDIEQNQQWAVVFSQTVPVKSAPDSQSTDLFVLHEGVKVEFLDTVGNWKKIRLLDGKVGWLTMESLQIL